MAHNTRHSNYHSIILISCWLLVKCFSIWIPSNRYWEQTVTGFPRHGFHYFHHFPGLNLHLPWHFIMNINHLLHIYWTIYKYNILAAHSSNTCKLENKICISFLDKYISIKPQKQNYYITGIKHGKGYLFHPINKLLATISTSSRLVP